MSASLTARFKTVLSLDQKKAKTSKTTASTPTLVDETPFKAILASFLILTGKIDIPSPSSTETILITSSDDEITHTVPLSHFINNSDFFAGLLTIPAPSDNPSQKSEPVILPNLPSAGFKLVLDILSLLEVISTPDNRAKLASSWLHKLDLILPEPSVISDGARIADRYAITFPHTHLQELLNHPSIEPRIAFALAAVSPNSTSASVRPYAITALVSGQRDLPFYLRQILARFAFVRLTRFDSFVSRHGKTVQNFRQSLRDALLGDGQVAGYTTKCPKNDGGNKGGKCCRANRLGLDWGDMKKDAADMVCAAVFKNGAESGSYYLKYTNKDLMAIMGKAVPCKRCAARFAHIFHRAVQQFSVGPIGDGEF